MFSNMKSLAPKLMILTAVLTGSGLAFANAPMCAVIFAGQPAAQEQQWRANTSATMLDASGQSLVIASNAGREKHMAEAAELLRQEILGTATTPGDVPYMGVEAAPGVQLVETQAPVYQTGRNSVNTISGLGPSGILHATLLLPVSGHVGRENALKWAKSDTYSVWADVNGKRIDLVRNVKSLDLITFQEIELQLVAGQKVRVSYQRSGNSIGGFFEGRVMDFVWDGK